MLLDSLMPRWDFRERHAIVVRATPERAYDAVLNADLSRSWVTRLLMVLRGMGLRPKRTSLRFAEGFEVAAEDAPREIVLGIEGPFWKPTCKPRGVSSFDAPVPAGVARGAFNFFIERIDGSRVRVTTETRVLCADDARRKFGLYWTFIRPGSGLIRRMMLRAIRAEAER